MPQVKVRITPKKAFGQTTPSSITEAYAVEGHNFNVSDTSSAVTILQAPEFISDADKAVDVTIDNYTAPFAVNGDI